MPIATAGEVFADGATIEVVSGLNPAHPQLMLWDVKRGSFQYRFAHRIYADYPTLVRSGQLQKTAGRQFTFAPKTVESVSDPLPGYLIRVVITPDGRSYQLSIQKKTFVDCAPGLFSDETGIIFDGHIPKAGIMYGPDACIRNHLPRPDPIA